VQQEAARHIAVVEELVSLRWVDGISTIAWAGVDDALLFQGGALASTGGGGEEEGSSGEEEKGLASKSNRLQLSLNLDAVACLARMVVLVGVALA
jgi:hypothetical protein